MVLVVIIFVVSRNVSVLVLLMKVGLIRFIMFLFGMLSVSVMLVWVVMI